MGTEVDALRSLVEMFKGAGSTAEMVIVPIERLQKCCLKVLLQVNLYSRGKCSVWSGGSAGLEGMTIISCMDRHCSLELKWIAVAVRSYVTIGRM